MTMLLRAFLTFGRLLALVAVGGVIYAVCDAPLLSWMFLGLFFVWAMVFGAPVLMLLFAVLLDTNRSGGNGCEPSRS